jgi:hypothetical protein
MTHPFRCACGAVTGVLAEPARARRMICYCRDCQDYARWLGREDDLLDARGASEVVAALPRHVRFDTGVERLACVRMTPAGPLRWYAACCNTPVATTAPEAATPLITLWRPALGGAAAMDTAFGPPRTGVFVEGARGGPPPRRFGVAGFLLWLVGARLSARLAGEIGKSPLFTAAGRPIAEPRTLTDAEHAALRAESRESRELR